MESIQQNYNDNFMEDGSNSPPSSPDINKIVGDPQVNPRIGSEYQVEVPSMNPADSEVEQDHTLSFATGLPLSGTWIANEMEHDGHEGERYVGDDDVTIKWDSESDQLGENKNHAMAPGTLSDSWSDADAKSFLLGLFIFRKNFIQIKRFLENKEIGKILSFYYGKFYKSDEYRRWSRCRKMKGRRCVIGQKLFTGRRQTELLSRLIPHVSEESQDKLQQVAKSYVERRASLEEYVSSLKSIVGLSVLVEAVGVGKEKEADLTRLAVEPAKNHRVSSAPPSQAWSSLRPSDIMNFLTGESRLSKAKSNDLFWEAVWPRLLARGWHSEQPKNQCYISSKDYLVFLIPGVEKFSRTKLVKGDHYFDSVSGVLSKVVAEPNLLELEGEEEAKVSSCNDEESERGLNEDDPSDYHRHCYLKPRTSFNTDKIKFMIIDTSLVRGGKSSDIRELKSLPGKLVGKVEVDAAGFKHKGDEELMHKANHKKGMYESMNQKLSKFTVIDTSRLHEQKKLKVQDRRNTPVELEDASKTSTSPSKESKGGGSSVDNSPYKAEANMQTHGEKNISNTHFQKSKSDREVQRKESYDNADSNADKIVESHRNQKNGVSDDNQLKRTIKHQFSRRARSGHSNHAIPIKRRRLTACVKAETNRILEKSSGGLGSGKPAFSQPSDANVNVGDLVTHQQNGSSIASPEDKCMEENNEESILNGTSHDKSISCGEVEKCESQSQVKSNTPQVPPKSENGDITAMVVEEPLRTTSCDVGAIEQINPRRQSTRNRPLTVKALESIANEFFHVPRRPKRKNIQTLNDPFVPCRRARSRVKTMLNHQHSSGHVAAASVEGKELHGDGGVSENILQAGLS